MSFQIIIDYDNIFENNPGLSSGMNGTVFNYQGDILFFPKFFLLKLSHQ